MKLYASITKTEKQDDGTLIVSGIASSEVVDSDGEVVTADAIKAAIPEYMRFGAVREMHQLKAAGTAISISVNDEGKTEFEAHVVDPVAVKKVETGVYKGFSIGGGKVKRNELNKKQIVGLSMTEISLVDRPANPEAVFTCYKAEGPGEEEITDVSAEPSGKEAAAAGDAVGDNAATSDSGDDQSTTEAPQEPELVKAVVGGKEVLMKANDDGTFSIVQKDAYQISQLASLCCSLEWFAQSEAYDAAMEGDQSTIAPQARKLAGQLYDLLLALVTEDVAEAKQRIKDAGKTAADAVDELQKREKLLDDQDPELAEFMKVFGAEGDTLKVVINKVVEQNLELTTKVNELNARPAPGKVTLKVVGKGEDIDTSTENTPEAEPKTPLDAVRKVHRDGGVVSVL